MRAAYVVQCLAQRMGDKEPCGLTWREAPGDAGGFVTEVNGVRLHIIGDETSPVYLTFDDGEEPYTIRESKWIHPSESRLGKFLNAVARRLGKKQNLISGPTKENDVKDEELRKALEELIKKVTEQCLNRKQSPDYLEKVKERLFQKVVGRL